MPKPYPYAIVVFGGLMVCCTGKLAIFYFINVKSVIFYGLWRESCEKTIIFV